MEKVDCGLKVFKADPQAERMLASGDTVWCYFRQYLFPWIQKNSKESAYCKIMSLAPGLRESTNKFIRIVRENQGMHVHEDSPQGSIAVLPLPFDKDGPMLQMLMKVHACFYPKTIVKSYSILRCNEIPIPVRRRTRHGPKETRLSHFEAAIAGTHNFFFDRIDEDTFAVAPFATIDKLFELPPDVFGAPAEWLPYTAVSAYERDEPTCDAIEFSDDDREDTGVVVPEIGHLPSLREYRDLEIDRRPAILEHWINELADASPMGDGWYSIDMPHYCKHNIPGRYISDSNSSLAKLTREARAVSVGGRCREADKPLSHMRIFARLLERHGLLSQYPMIARYATHYRRWREEWSKQELTSIGYGGMPRGDAWNPVTWTLFVQVWQAAQRLLVSEDYSYLANMFGDRPRPLYSRLYYAICAEEAKDLLLAREDFESHGYVVRSLIYDNLLIEGYDVEHEERLLTKHDLDLKPLHQWQDNVFMCLRRACSRLPVPVLKIDGGKKLCGINSLLTFADLRMAGALKKFKRNGPVTIQQIQSLLLSGGISRHYLVESRLDQIIESVPESIYLMAARGHCVGIKVDTAAAAHIADDSYAEQCTIPVMNFAITIRKFMGDHPDVEIDFFRLEKGVYVPQPCTQAFRKSVGGYADPDDFDEDADEFDAVFEKTTQREVADVIEALRSRGARPPSTGAGKRWLCPMCMRDFASKQKLLQHVCAKHKCQKRCLRTQRGGEQRRNRVRNTICRKDRDLIYGTRSRKQRALMKALWDEDQIIRMCGVVHGAFAAQPSNGLYLQRNRDVMLSDLAQSPSWDFRVATAQEKGVHMDEYIRYLLDGDRSRFILKKDIAGYHQIGSKFFATTRFLNDVYSAMLHPSTKVSPNRIHARVSDLTGWRWRMLPARSGGLWGALCGALLEIPFVKGIRKVCRSLADKRVIAVDSQYKPLMSVLYQTPHGQAVRPGVRNKGNAIHCVHTVACPGMILLSKPQFSEHQSLQLDSLLEATGEDGCGDVEFVFSDHPPALDQRVLYAKLPSLLGVGKDPLHIALAIEKFSNAKQTKFTKYLRRCLVKFREGFDDDRPYFRKGMDAIRSPTLKSVRAGLTRQRALSRRKAIQRSGFPQLLYKDVNDFLIDIASLTMEPATKMTAKVWGSLTTATSRANLEYLMNGPRYAARNPAVKLPYGTTSCEAYHAESKAYFSDIREQTARNAEAVCKVMTLIKLLGGIGSTSLKSTSGFSQGDIMRRYCAATADLGPEWPAVLVVAGNPRAAVNRNMKIKGVKLPRRLSLASKRAVKCQRRCFPPAYISCSLSAVAKLNECGTTAV